ncbi:MAG: hypothetical protein WB797_17180 [Nocardioides sp.]
MSTTHTSGVPGPDRGRTSFRAVGIVLLVMALALLGVGLEDFFSSLGSDSHEAADRIWMAFVGLLLLGPAGWCLQVGFIRSPAPRGPWCPRCGAVDDAAADVCGNCGTAVAG